ncbi:three-Cys-motif partner protein TcmP (plasmid) [Roseibium aggregatum]|nr:three-Cys-motif partner protein TcmP [Roseibium aggregatum]
MEDELGTRCQFRQTSEETRSLWKLGKYALAKKEYDWPSGVVLEDHTRKKLDILRSYFHNYLRVKCTPLNRSFRIAIVDGMAGGGVYEGGASGSPLVFLEELAKFLNETTIWRRDQGLPDLEIECLFVVNDNSRDAWQTLGPHLSAWQEEHAGNDKLKVTIVRLEKRFEEVYGEIKQRILENKHSNVLFNLDPCGYTQVGLQTIQDIVVSFKNPEVFFTFMIGALLNYSSWNNPQKTHKLIADFGVKQDEFFGDEALRTKGEWLGTVERVLHGEVLNIANYVSPFAINRANNAGYNYWLMHFSKSHRAREVYNDVLHLNAGGQAHFGKSGLKMLDYRSDDSGLGTLDWGIDMRPKNVAALHNDLPQFIAEFGDTITVGMLKASIYNDTTIHSDDLKKVLIENQDIEVFTQAGHPRRSSIKDEDLIRVTVQKNLFPALPKKRNLVDPN